MSLVQLTALKREGGSGIQQAVRADRPPPSWLPTAARPAAGTFAGSGTALIAAEMSGRSCYALELSPAYCDVAVARWERFTGKQARREDHADT
jgi:hypothetical protein